MKDTLKELLLECLKDAKQSKGGLDPNKYPSQVGLKDLLNMFDMQFTDLVQLRH